MTNAISQTEPTTSTRVDVDPNAPVVWDALWTTPEDRDWRAVDMGGLYHRISQLLPRESKVVDLGGGIGMLAEILRDTTQCEVEVWEHSSAAIEACKAKDIPARRVDLEDLRLALPIAEGQVVVATEVLEHLSDAALERVMAVAQSTGKPCFFSVPNDRLTPEEEPQHRRSWTALGFLTFLRRRWPDARVEVLGPKAGLNPYFPSNREQPKYLLGVVGIPKKVGLSVCWPARDEAADIERCLASFRGFADEMVIGIDPRTKDNTREIAEKYAEVVFDLDELRGPPDDEVPEGGFHFSHARNKCMDRCTMPWIFMTEAHEPIVEGQDALLNLDQIEDYVQIANVVRTGGRAPYREQWLFPWLTRNNPDIRYARSTHNTLAYDDKKHPQVIITQIKTYHERVHANALARQSQRKVQNRVKLMDDWRTNGNEFSLSYLGTEWAMYSPEKAVHYLQEFLNVSKFGTLRYHTRLTLARLLVNLGRIEDARAVLHNATGDDWSRIEHFMYLGDLAYEEGHHVQALQFYSYAVTRRGNPPLTTWWIDTAMYTWIPAQRLAQTHAALNRYPEALQWARLVLDDLLAFGEDAPEQMVTEARANVKILEDEINEQSE